MKRLFSMIALTLACASVYAQCWIGGTAGIGVTTVSGQGESSTATTIGIAPEIGYEINDKVAVAAEIELDCTSGDSNQTIFGVGPYLRYNMAKSGIVTFFGEVASHYVNAKYGKSDAIGGFDIQLRPGIAVELSNSVSLVGKFSLLDYTHLSKNNFDVNTTSFGVTTNLSVGFVCRF